MVQEHIFEDSDQEPEPKSEEYEGADDLQAEVERRAQEAEAWEAAATEAWEAQLISSPNWEDNLDAETPEAAEAKRAAVVAAAWRAALTVSAPWQAIADPESGRPYYWNRDTNATRWDLPFHDEPTQPDESTQPAADPRSATDSDGAQPVPEQHGRTDETEHQPSATRRMRWSQMVGATTRPTVKESEETPDTDEEVLDIPSNANLPDACASNLEQLDGSSDEDVPSLWEDESDASSNSETQQPKGTGLTADAERFLAWKREHGQFEKVRSSTPISQKIQAKDLQAELEHAMAIRDVASLQAALDDAETARLSLQLLEAARSLLREEQLNADNRKRRARTGLTDAMAIHDVQILSAAIKEAEQAKLSDEELHEAWEVYRDEERRSVCTEALKQAIMFKEIECLSAAIEEGESAGADGRLLKKAKEVLVEEEGKADARERLQEAIENRDQGEMWSAIYHGEQCGLAEMELQRARKLLEKMAEEEATEQARDALNHAVTCCHEHQLRLALQEAERVGLPSEELEQARAALVNEEEKSRLRQDLRDAIRRAVASKNIDHLTAAMEAGRDGGLEEPDFIEANRALQREEKKASARKSLYEAIQSQERNDLSLAMGLCIEAGLPEAELEPVRTSLERHAQVDRVQALLEDAVQQRHIPSVQAIMAEGQGLPLPPKLLEEAHAILAELKKQGVARQRLARAVRSGKVDLLRSALAEARAANIEDAELNVAKVSLLYAENAEKEAEAGAEREARARQEDAARGRLQKALQGNELYALRSAISACEAAALAEEEIHPGRQALAELVAEDRKVEARYGLQKSIATQDLEALRSAISAGTVAGLLEQELKPARDNLVYLERKAEDALQALSDLDAAISARDVDLLRSALEAGDQAGLEPSLLEPARHLLDSSLRRGAALARIDQVLSLRMCATAIVQLKQHALRQRFEEARRRISASKSPSAAVETTSRKQQDPKEYIEGLRLAIRAGEEQGMRASELRPARRALAEATGNLRLEAEGKIGQAANPPSAGAVDSDPDVLVRLEADPTFARQVLQRLVEPEIASSTASFVVLVQAVRNLYSDPAVLQAKLLQAAAAVQAGQSGEAEPLKIARK